MVEAYWKIGRAISEACGGNERAAYGQHVLEYISQRLTAEFGKGFTVANLRNMRQFYAAFPKRNALRSELSWTHYRLLMRVADADVRQWYADEAAKAGDLTHQDLGQMQMYVNYYTRTQMNPGDNPPIGLLLCATKSDTLVKMTLPEGQQQIYAAKYLPYLPTEEELRRELNLSDYEKLTE